jgi:hypothetical protein
VIGNWSWKSSTLNSPFVVLNVAVGFAMARPRRFMACTQRAAVPASRVILEKTAMVVFVMRLQRCEGGGSRRWRIVSYMQGQRRFVPVQQERASSESNSERSPRGARPLATPPLWVQTPLRRQYIVFRKSRELAL